jgi:hypothetical protein
MGGEITPLRKDTAMPSTIRNTNRTTALAALDALIRGLQKQFPGASFTLESHSFTTSELELLIQGVIDALNAVPAAEVASRAAVANVRDRVAKARPILGALKRNLLSMFGNAPQTLALFGLKPLKAKAPRTSEQKALAAARARATRAARGTASKKKKAAIKGNVTGVAITPITMTVASAGPTEGRVRTQIPASAGPTEGRVRTQIPTSPPPPTVQLGPVTPADPAAGESPQGRRDSGPK